MKIKGFTLAEILITLTVLGVIAAITIPSIHRRWQTLYTVTALKKIYADLYNAYDIALVENGPVSNYGSWGWQMNTSGTYNGTLHWSSCQEQANADVFAQKLYKNLNISKFCGTDSTKHCFQYGWENKNGKIVKYSGNYGGSILTLNGNSLNGWLQTRRNQAILKNGMRIYIQEICPATRTLDGTVQLGSIVVDINGEKGPNQWGKDFFQFSVGPKEILPGYYWSGNALRECNIKYDGTRCSNYILRYGNMDYLKRDITLDEWKSMFPKISEGSWNSWSQQ